MLLRPLYWFFLLSHGRSWFPRRLQIAARRRLARKVLARSAGKWPIDEAAGAPPAGWRGWPEGREFGLLLTHDVDSQRGLERCRALMDLEERLGFRSAFYFVPRGQYEVPESLRKEMVARGFEVGVHGLYHDWWTFLSRRVFERRAPLIREYLKAWGAVGFRAASMIKNLNWIRELGVEYDASTFDTDPFEPIPEGVGTIFPFWVEGHRGHPGYVELPYTVAQDHTLFVLLKAKGPTVWQQKIEWLVRRGGLALIDTHPDYLHLGPGAPAPGEYPGACYEAFLNHVRERYRGAYWHVLPRDMARFCASRRETIATKTLRRMCMLAYAFYDTDNRIIRYASTLVKQGNEVDAIGLRADGTPRASTVDGVNVFRIQRRRRDERARVTYLLRILAFWVKSSIVLTCRHLWQRYDVVHVHSVPDFEVFAAWAAKLMGAKIILDIHDLVPEFYLSKFGASRTGGIFRALLWVERTSAAFADHVIIANHLWHERLVQRSVPKRKCTAIPNYVDTSLFYPRLRTRTDSRFVLIYPGVLQKHQGVDVAIRAFPRILDQIPLAEFHIYGSGPELPALRRLVHEAGVEGRVVLHDPIDFRLVPEAIANADVGLVPKRAEGFGGEAYSTKIMEYMSQGIPVVASRTPVDEFYFGHTVVSFFESGNEEDLARAVLALARDPDARRQVVEEARRFVAENCWATKQHEYLALVARLVGDDGGGGRMAAAPNPGP